MVKRVPNCSSLIYRQGVGLIHDNQSPLSDVLQLEVTSA